MTYGTLISTQTVGVTSVASIDFNSIPQTYTDLLLVFSTRFSASGGAGDTKMTVNGSTTGFTYRQLTGNGSTVGQGTGGGTYVGRTNPTSYTSNIFSNTSIYIPNYTTSLVKSFNVASVEENNATGAIQGLMTNTSTITSAITSLSLSDFGGGGNTFVQYSTASLYGIK